jgi:hypothetical protein
MKIQFFATINNYFGSFYCDYTKEVPTFLLTIWPCFIIISIIAFYAIGNSQNSSLIKVGIGMIVLCSSLLHKAISFNGSIGASTFKIPTPCPT